MKIINKSGNQVASGTLKLGLVYNENNQAEILKKSKGVLLNEIKR